MEALLVVAVVGIAIAITILAVLALGGRIPPSGGLAVAIALLSAFMAQPASAQTQAPCSGSLSLWSATQTSTGGNQRVLVGSRAEGGCNALAGIRAFGRLDAYALPGRTVSLADPSTFENVAAVEGWAGLSHPVAGPLSLAVFGGVQRSLEGGQLGVGGATQSLCAGGRLDYGGGFAVGGLCSRYSPAQQSTPRRDGPALVGTVVLPVKSSVHLAANAAVTRGDYVFTVGPAISIGSGN